MGYFKLYLIMNFLSNNFDDIDIKTIEKDKIEDLICSIKEIDNTTEQFLYKEFLLANHSKLVSLEKIILKDFDSNNNKEDENIINVFKKFLLNEKIKFINFETHKFVFRKDDTENFISINLSLLSNVIDLLNNLPNILTTLEIKFIPYTWIDPIVKNIADPEDDLDEDKKNYTSTDVIFNNLNINNLPTSLKKIIFKMDICRANLLVNIFLDKIKIPKGITIEFNFINSNYYKKVCINKLILPDNIKNIIIKYLPETRISLSDDIFNEIKKNNITYEIINDMATKNKLIIEKILYYNS